MECAYALIVLLREKESLIRFVTTPFRTPTCKVERIYLNDNEIEVKAQAGFVHAPATSLRTTPTLGRRVYRSG